jgi:patatin-like phospholipase/acyl hydrolase
MEHKDDKTFKILSIDGGGIKGLWSLYVLDQLEKKFCNENETLSDYFDMICGTSTGGIVALGLASGRKCSYMIDMYEKNASNVFPGHNGSYIYKKLSGIWRYVKMLCGSKYDETPLQKISSECFGKTTMSQGNNLLCIPSYDLMNGRNIVFKYPHNEGRLTRDGDILMSDVAMSTSAAQTFFPLHYFSASKMNGYFVDGGMWANDPSMVGITEALRFFVGKDKQYNRYEILSVGNMIENTCKALKSRYRFWNILNIPYLIDTFFTSNSQSICQYCRTISEHTNGHYTRIECVNPPYTNNGQIAMDNSSSEFIDHMKSNANSLIIDMITPSNKIYDGSIENFFANKKTYVTNQYE